MGRVRNTVMAWRRTFLFLASCVVLTGGQNSQDDLQLITVGEVSEDMPNTLTPHELAMAKKAKLTPRQAEAKLAAMREEMGEDMVKTVDDCEVAAAVELRDRLEGRGPLGLIATKNFAARVSSKWPNGRVPYLIEGNFTHEQRDVIAESFVYIQNVSCIRFVPKTEEHRDYLKIHNNGFGCAARIGYRRGSGQHLCNLMTPQCMHHGLVVHELLHVLGADHEHTRPDRDDYVKLLWRNVGVRRVANFFKDQWFDDTTFIPRCNVTDDTRQGDEFNDCVSGSRRTDFGFAYDYESIMHYSRVSFANPRGKWTIYVPRSTVPGRLGNTLMSDLDVAKLNWAYGCADRPAGGDSCNMHVEGDVGGEIKLTGEKDDGCRVLVAVPDGKVAWLAFEEFMVHNCANATNVVNSSSVFVFDGPTSGSKRLGHFCGEEDRPTLIKAKGTEVMVLVRLREGEKVSFRWSAESAENCCPVIDVAAVSPATARFLAGPDNFNGRWLGTYRQVKNKYSAAGSRTWPVYYSTREKGIFLSHMNLTYLPQSWCFLRDPVQHGYPGGVMFLLGASSCPTEFDGFQYGDGGKLVEEPGAVRIECVPQVCEGEDLRFPPNSTSDFDGAVAADGSPGDVVSFSCLPPMQHKMLYSRCSVWGEWSDAGSCDDDGGGRDSDHNRDEEEEDEEEDSTGLEPSSRPPSSIPGASMVLSGCPSMRENFLHRMSEGETVVVQSEGFDGREVAFPPGRATCRWKFLGPKPGSRLLFTIRSGELGLLKSRNCSKEKLSIAATRFIGKKSLCGSLGSSLSVVSTRAFSYIVFSRADNKAPRVGFRIAVQAV